MDIVNIAGYQFKQLTDLTSLKQELMDFCVSGKLKGTLLISPEGINIFLCGSRDIIDNFYSLIREKGFSIPFKESLSATQPFKKMLVKIKTHIIPFSYSVSPIEQPAPYISAQEFKNWLDNNKSMVVLDTRNTYEIELGKFKDATLLDIEHFRDFPQVIDKLSLDKNGPIVTYCTGGIRAEKAALHLISQGFKEVYQLQGGILEYFEKYQDAHFEGDCFVFDNRIALQPDLEERGL